MSQLEAWIVTALGMGVVFAGLLLCVVFINVFNRLAQHVKWGEEGHGHGHGAPAPTQAPPPAASAPAPAASEPLAPEVVAAIAAAAATGGRPIFAIGSSTPAASGIKSTL